MPWRGSQKEKDYIANYQLKHQHIFKMVCYDTKDNDIIQFLEDKKPINAYLKKLVIEDMSRNK